VAHASQKITTAADKTTPPELAEAARLNAAIVKLVMAGKYEEALPLANRILEIREKAFGNESKQVADALMNIATIQQQLTHVTEAEKFYKRALSIYEKGGDENAAQIAEAVDGLARIDHDLEDAVRLFERSLKLKEKAYGIDSPQLAPTLFALGNLNEMRGQKMRGDYDRAEKFFGRYITVLEKASPVDNDDAAIGYLRLSCLLGKRDKEAEAKADEDIALRIFRGGGSGQSRIIEGVTLSGRELQKPPPAGYPREALGKQVHGKVEVKILVAESGRVLSACAMSGPKLLRPSSEYAAYNALFAPVTVGGKPAKAWSVITYTYTDAKLN
jgi:tetratricopeptide (TPR) repeat protein